MVMAKIDEDALAWMLRQSERPLTAEEQAAFDAWHDADVRHSGAYLRAQAIWAALDTTALQKDMRPSPGTLAAESNPSILSHKTSRRALLIGGASGLTAAAIAGVFALPKHADGTVLKTAVGEFRKVPLADRSVASLNSASHIEVSMTAKARRVILTEGEAWFEVAKDPEKPFSVEAGNVRIQAVGTAFSVRRRDTGADVMVTEGVVLAWTDGGSGERRKMVAGEEAFIPDHAAEITVSAAPAEIERKLAWRDGNLVFDNDTLLSAVDDFNRYNAQKLVIADPALREERFFGQYKIDAPQRFAQDVRDILNVPVTVRADVIVIGSEPASHVQTSVS
jgi:transmembrane sensor